MRRPPRLIRIALPLGLALSICVAAWGAGLPQSFGGLESRDYKIETDETNSNLNSGEFTMPHAVRFYRPGTDATASHAQGNYKRGTATLIGNVVVHDSGNAPEAGGEAAYGGSGPATLTCDRLEIDSKQKLYTAIGHVHFAQSGRTGSANRGVLDRSSGLLHLEGDVHLQDNASTLVASIVDYNLNTKDAQVRGGPAVMSQPANQPLQPIAPKPQPRKSP
jgi:lipopolysaccharide export system protein LptA